MADTIITALAQAADEAERKLNRESLWHPGATTPEQEALLLALNGKSARSQIDYDQVLGIIQDHLDAAQQWLGLGDFTRTATYQTKAEALIELLEVHNCGSVGGFDVCRGINQGHSMGHKHNIADRFRWLKEVR